jgi:hypothetical protein
LRRSKSGKFRRERRPSSVRRRPERRPLREDLQGPVVQDLHHRKRTKVSF